MTISTASQRKELYKLFGYCKETEALHVSEVTKGKAKTAKGLSIRQADELKRKLVTNWGNFKPTNTQHKYILSLLIQLGWTVPHKTRGQVADIFRLSNFLKSKKSPVCKPLLEMSVSETSKLISCFESMITKTVK